MYIKAFRKLSDDEKLKGFGGLLKLYQEEIDTLSKQAKFSENSFLNVYKFLAQAPDPVLGLTAVQANHEYKDRSNSRISELELENKRLKTELEEFRKDFQEIKNQEVTIRKLEEQIEEYEIQFQEIVVNKIKESQEKMEMENNKTLNSLREKEVEIEKIKQQYNNEINRLQHTLEICQTELLDLKSNYDSKQIAKQTEDQMLQDEVDRLRIKLLTVESQYEKLLNGNDSNKIKGTASGSIINSSISGNSVTFNTDLELEVAQKDIEIQHLREEYNKLEQQTQFEITNLKIQLHSSQEQLTIQISRCKEYEERIINNPTVSDYKQLQEQLEVLKKAFEYNDVDAGGSINVTHQSIDYLLKSKIRKLETEVVQLKVQINEKTQQLQESKDKNIQLETKVEDYKKLVSKLEEDILKNNNNNSNNNNNNNSDNNEEEKLSGLLLQQQQNKKTGNNSNNSGNNNNSNNNKVSGGEETTMLQIVISQRDRFKLRIQDLEEQIRVTQLQSENKSNEITNLRHDNIKLYEKIKYLQSYSNYNNNNKMHDIESNKEEEIDTKYSKLYEETVNPFVIFNRKERYRRYNELSAADKVILNAGRFFMGSKGPRLFLFFYSVLLHLLVFLTLYKVAHTSSCT